MPIKPPSFRPGYEQERLSSRQRGYDSEWTKLSRRFRAEHPLCCGCEAMGFVEPATVVDHIEPHQGDQAKLLDDGNLQPACDWHHSAVKQRLEQLWFAGAIGVADLRLDSAQAVSVARQTPRKPAVIGTDGWPQG